MVNECSACSCNDQKEIDETTGLSLDKKNKKEKENLNEKE